MKLRSIILSMLLGMTAITFAKNEQQTVEQVTGTVTIGDKMDYHITSTTPFSTMGSIALSSTSNSVVIFDALLPSQAKSYLANITIDGAKAVNGTNCQLRIYKAGAMVLPYNQSEPLTVYTEANYGGSANSSYEVNTIYSLSNDKVFNNSIRSFKLKRGYMVCFATKGTGQGYSRVFIADHDDLEVKVMPNVLNGRVSYIRISKWNNVIKRGWAGFWSNETQELLNTGWAYNWDANTHNDWTDREYVTQHHHEGWPGIADVGNNSGSANILGNNEPDNKADDKEQDIDVKNVLANWPQMMATGRRLGSPAVSSNYSWLYEFIDSIDARGWRCDFIAVHSYWYKDVAGWKSQLESISKRCGGRPIWITEMNYGANWTGWPGSDTSGSEANYAIEKQHMGPILDYLNTSDIIERYAFYNNVQDCRYAIAGGQLTPIGEYYANLTPNLAYNEAKEFIPKSPKTVAPTDFTTVFNASKSTCVLSWVNPNGEYIDSMLVERKRGIKGTWERLGSVDVNELETTTYTYVDNVTESGDYYYRIHMVDFDKKDLYSTEIANAVNGTECADENTDVQWGTMTASTTDMSYNYFKHTFDEVPAVVFGSPSSRNSNTKPVEYISRISAVNDKYAYFSSGFLPWNAGSTDTDTFAGAEMSSYIVAKAGNGMFGDLRYEAGTMKKTGSTSNLTLGKDTVEYKFNVPFDEVPLVFLTPYGAYNPKYPFIARVWDVTKEGFKAVMTRQKALDETYPTSFTSSKVSYLAIEKGVTTVGGNVVLVKDSLMTFTSSSSGKSIAYDGVSYNETPAVLCQLQSFDRKGTAMLRTGYSGPSKTSCSVRMVPDGTDTNMAITALNPCEERVGMISIGAGATTGIGNVKTEGSTQLDVQLVNGHLVVNDASASSVSIHTAAGMMVAKASLANGEASISLSSLPEGVLIVKSNKGKSVKIIVRR